jgi:sec-independent protein translocase protein TatB
MFGIGLPEMILILALALIVVGPDKLPDLARSLAKGVMELKKTAETLKKSLTEDGTLDSLKPDLTNLLESSPWETKTPGEGVNPVPDKTDETIIEAELTVIDDSKADPPNVQATDAINAATETAAPEKEADSPPIRNASQKP